LIYIKKITAVETYKIRLEVLKTCEAYLYKYQGDFLDTTIHFGAFNHNKHIGIVSLMRNEHINFNERQVQLRGMAVLQKSQGKKVGKKLINVCVDEAKKNNIHLIWCNVRDYSVDFYKKQGFIITEEKFFIKNVCDHYLMYLQITN
jgi:predicted N-acetyltransferase YhbS